LNKIRESLEPESVKESTSIEGWRAMVAGAMAGTFCWFVSFPPDVVKTRLQCATRFAYPTKFYDGGFWHVFDVVLRE
jgi:hypothetical protein